MKGRTVNIKIKKALRDSITVPTWTWNLGPRFSIQTMVLRYLRGACGLKRVHGERNENVSGKVYICPLKIN